ncbi:MAG: PQQ-binding-like beta-propeller repeat protein [Candidatus Paracaedibacteraceae bacterium]|nr:PQQ-binding-like beta-propeller repeat protein [Candidatus Paracaedibacteraceae bacterium]
MMNRIFLLLTATTILTSCDTFSSKPPLEGKRESIFTQESTVKSESTVGKALLTLGTPHKNNSWSVPGGSLDHTLSNLALSAHPKKIWSSSIGSGNSSSQKLVSNLVVDNGVIFGMDTHGQVTALSLNDGQKLWSTNTSPAGSESETLGGGIAINGSKIIVTTSFGDILALDAKTGKELWKQSPQTPFRIAPTVTGSTAIAVNVANEALAVDTSNGNIKWTHIGLPEATGLLGGGVPAISGNKIVIPYSTGELYALDLSTGQLLWVEALNPATAFDPLSSISHIRARPVILNGKVYAISHGGRMAAFDLNTGSKLWQKDIGGVRTPAVYGGYMFMVTNENDLVCLDSTTSKIIWAKALTSPAGEEKTVWAGPILANGKLILTNTKGDIVFFNPTDGTESSKINHGDSLALSPIVVDGKLIVLSENATVTAYS